jgi:5-methylcytosine-specific restriction endonuclease McrA
MKKCGACKEVKSKSNFYKCKSRVDGLRGLCKSCNKTYVAANRENISIRSKTWRENNKEQRAVQAKAYYEENKARIAIYGKNHYEINKAKITARNKVYNETNKEHLAVTGKAYREANKEQTTLKIKVWRQLNPERIIIHTNKRRALKRNSEGTYTHTDINILLLTQDSKCVYCKTDLIITGKGKYHVDHIMPLFLGGSNYPENLQLLCQTCNLSKGSKHPNIYEKQINHNQNKEL